jgi:NAD(P)-dependent dehydrogenase (short-subunit alcohol dehydrogenase family)
MTKHVDIAETPAIVKLVTLQNISMETFTENYTQKQCLKRLGAPQKLINLIVFLASNLCPFVMGANFTIDGGYTSI